MKANHIVNYDMCHIVWFVRSSIFTRATNIYISNHRARFVALAMSGKVLHPDRLIKVGVKPGKIYGKKAMRFLRRSLLILLAPMLVVSSCRDEGMKLLKKRINGVSAGVHLAGKGALLLRIAATRNVHKPVVDGS